VAAGPNGKGGKRKGSVNIGVEKRNKFRLGKKVGGRNPVWLFDIHRQGLEKRDGRTQKGVISLGRINYR